MKYQKTNVVRETQCKLNQNRTTFPITEFPTGCFKTHSLTHKLFLTSRLLSGTARLRRCPSVRIEVCMTDALREGKEISCSVNHYHEFCVIHIQMLSTVLVFKNQFCWFQSCKINTRKNSFCFVIFYWLLCYNLEKTSTFATNQLRTRVIEPTLRRLAFCVSTIIIY